MASSELTTASVVDLMQCQHFSNPHLGNGNQSLRMRSSRRDVLDLDGSLLWARSLRLVGGLGRLHDLHVRLDGQMIGESVACGIDAMRSLIDRRAGDGCKSSLDRPTTCPGVTYDFVGAGQLPVKTRHQRYPGHNQGRRTYGGETDVAGVNAVLPPAGD